MLLRALAAKLLGNIFILGGKAVIRGSDGVIRAGGEWLEQGRIFNVASSFN